MTFISDHKLAVYINSCLAFLTPIFVMSGIQQQLFILWFLTGIVLFFVMYITLLTGIVNGWFD